MKRAQSKEGQSRVVYKFSKFATMNFRPAYHAKAHPPQRGLV